MESHENPKIRFSLSRARSLVDAGGALFCQVGSNPPPATQRAEFVADPEGSAVLPCPPENPNTYWAILRW